MDNMQYAEELVREYLVFRGFTSTLQTFEKELSTDIGKGFQCFSSFEAVLTTALAKLEVSILKFYIIHAIQFERTDKVIEFFELNGNDLLGSNEDWTSWFAIPYIKNPSSDSRFRIYFSKEWYDALHLSVRNFLSEIFNGTRIPALLKISSESNTVKSLKNNIKHLNLKLSQLQALLEEKETRLSPSMSRTLTTKEISADEDVISPSITGQEAWTPASMDAGGVEFNQDVDVQKSSSAHGSSLRTSSDVGYGMEDFEEDIHREEEFPEVKVVFQETFLGHTSPISRCRFSASGDNIASASVDGTVRIWTYDSATPVSRSATIYCGAEIMSLEWDCKSDRLLLIGTADGGIKAWNADAKRVVCDLSTTEAYPSVVDLKCSPVEPIFVSAAASRGEGTDTISKLGCASLTVWNMRTWKAMTVLPLGEDPPAITSLCFNHNGKILAAAASDGMIHMFDMSAGLQITGWPAHDSAISSVLFGPDETSIFSLGSDGKESSLIFEWSLQSPGKVLWSRNCNRFCNPHNSLQPRHEMALDANGRRLLVTSGSVRAPIYQVRAYMNGMRTLPHSAAITTVDWHPTLPIFLTGSADNSVRVTSIS
ncbi:WD repeat-containing protein 91-like [Heracleum sosnowskyi]|uniref:WD repeat-containing protein 91-like n=1 Tax=Heracleum sosnowskyi TaxID=360622 RepID=A0AAD8N1H1_9APIA|nr:WD repeat-containing protein 91-like [Heracleum sosnowskyi]